MQDLGHPQLHEYLTAERAFYDESTSNLRTVVDRLEAQMRAHVPDAEVSEVWREQGWQLRWTRPSGAEHGRLEGRPESAAPDAAWRTLLDLDPLAGRDGHVELGVCTVSPDGSLLAYSLDSAGDERFELRFRDMATGTDRPASVHGCYAGGAWAADSRIFFVLVPDEAWRPFQVRRIVAGVTDGSLDLDDHEPDDLPGELVLQEDDPTFDLDVELTRSGMWVLITAASRDTTEQWAVPADQPTATPRSLAGRRPGVEYHADHAPASEIPGGDAFVLVTNDGAPEFRLVRMPVDGVGPAEWERLIDEHPGERLLDVAVFARHAVLELRVEGRPALRVVRRRDSESALDLGPGIAAGSIELVHDDVFDTDTIDVEVQSLVTPRVVQRVDLDTGKRETVHRADVPGLDVSQYRSERLAVVARDGTSVPVVLAWHANVALDGTAPCVLTGYGAYEVVSDPWFEVAHLPLLNAGVVLALAHVRGGGELGRDWWQQGRLTGKPTSWHDLVDVADSLGSTVVDGRRIVIRGISAGGLLVAGAMLERPDLFAAVVAEVPFVDVLTTMLDDSLPLTAGEWAEWGDPRDPAGYADMASWSPMDRPVPARRPPLLVTGALHDTRVLVTEPAKWVARLRQHDAATGVDPRRTLFRAEVGEGAHAGPSGRLARLRYEAEVLAWVLAQLGVQPG
jgi:oligopeptidase B